MAVAIKEDRPVRGVEILVKRPDGSSASILPYPTPLHDSAGRLTGAVNVLVDITPLRLAEDAMRRNDRRFRTLTEHAPAGIFLADTGGDYLLVNHRWLDLAGVGSQEVALGQGWTDALHADDRERVLAEWQHFVEDGGAGGDFDSEFRFAPPSATPLWVKCSATSLVAGAEEPAGYIGTVTDITELKQAEQLKDQFLSLISHELRTPLATIYGSSRLLNERFDLIPADDRAQLLSDVVAEADRLQRIIENLLLLTRLEAAGMELDPVSLQVVVKKTVDKLRSRQPTRPFILRLEEDAAAVLGNPTYIELVLENLLGNALKYSEPNIPIEVELASDGDNCTVRILDRGIGLDAKTSEQLFAPFYRSPQARLLASGVGIGLSVCRRVIEVQQGRIWGHSRPDGGAEFGFTLCTAGRDE
jgi:PAS domain S-box-containing protein